MSDATRKTITDIYVRVCKDSGFSMPAVKAMAFAAEVLKVHPLHVWAALPSLDVAEAIASGNHPSAKP